MSGTENNVIVAPIRGADKQAAPTVRLSVEQASYAYHTRGSTAPVFTLAATSFSAKQREIVSILGPNASGKSTLLKLIAGTLEPLSGRVELEGFETSRLEVAHSGAAHRHGASGKSVAVSCARLGIRSAGTASLWPHAPV